MGWNWSQRCLQQSVWVVSTDTPRFKNGRSTIALLLRHSPISQNLWYYRRLVSIPKSWICWNCLCDDHYPQGPCTAFAACVRWRLPNLWEVPGGEVKSAETLVQCAVRELKEETGLALFLTWLANSVVTISDSNGDLEIKLDPQKHQGYLWATETDIRDRSCCRTHLQWISSNQQQSILAAFETTRAWIDEVQVLPNTVRRTRRHLTKLWYLRRGCTSVITFLSSLSRLGFVNTTNLPPRCCILCLRPVCSGFLRVGSLRIDRNCYRSGGKDGKKKKGAQSGMHQVKSWEFVWKSSDKVLLEYDTKYSGIYNDGSLYIWEFKVKLDQQTLQNP